MGVWNQVAHDYDYAKQNIVNVNVLKFELLTYFAKWDHQRSDHYYDVPQYIWQNTIKTTLITIIMIPGLQMYRRMLFPIFVGSFFPFEEFQSEIAQSFWSITFHDLQYLIYHLQSENTYNHTRKEPNNIERFRIELLEDTLGDQTDGRYKHYNEKAQVTLQYVRGIISSWRLLVGSRVFINIVLTIKLDGIIRPRYRRLLYNKIINYFCLSTIKHSC